MIEKFDDQNGFCMADCMDKINEVIDAVNELQKHEEQHLDLLTQLNEMRLHQNKEPTENVQDKFAEHRKWIGKLCKFWNFKDGAVDIGILKVVDNLTPPIPYINDLDCRYAFCEPVKPDDDIIYKGLNNE